MDEKLILITILGMALVTYLPRLLPLLALSGKKLPDVVVAWLGYVPGAVLAAMLFPSLLIVDGNISIAKENLYFWAAIPTFIAAILTKKLFLPVVVGMLTIILGRWLM